MKLVNALLAANLLLLLFLGLRIVFKFSVWSPIDEGAHFNYIQFVAENKRLPVLKKDYASWQVLSIGEGIYPEKTSTDPTTLGFGGFVYEAFQPPLYYLISLPAFSLGGGNFLQKVAWLRAQDFIILLASLFLCWKLTARLFSDEGKRNIFRIVGVFFFLMPGILLRNITISNCILELALTAILFYFLVAKENIWWAGVVLGLLFLSRFTSIFLYGIFGLVLAGNLLTKIVDEGSLRPKAISKLLLPAIIPLVMLAPWFHFNYTHFGSLTANALSKEIQKPVVNPDDKDYKPKDLIPMGDTLMDTFVLPEEWGIDRHTFVAWGAGFFKILVFFIVLPTSIFLTLYRIVKIREKTAVKTATAIWKENRTIIICAGWLLLNILMLSAIIVKENWPVRLGRYIYASTLPMIYLTTEALNFLFKKRGQLVLLFLSEIFILMVWAGIAISR